MIIGRHTCAPYIPVHKENAEDSVLLKNIFIFKLQMRQYSSKT